MSRTNLLQIESREDRSQRPVPAPEGQSEARAGTRDDSVNYGTTQRFKVIRDGGDFDGMAQISPQPPLASNDEMSDEDYLDDSASTWVFPNIMKARGGETPSHGYGMALIPEG